MKKKVKFLTKLTSLAIILVTSPTFVLASDTIGTAEVKTATDNIKNVITSIAMPLGRSSYFCKCCNCSTSYDSKCKQS